jgi:hypothetical protein
MSDKALAKGALLRPGAISISAALNFPRCAKRTMQHDFRR